MECKQEKKVCVHNIPEGGVQEWSYKSGGKPLEIRLITRLKQGRPAACSEV
jgi:hypothetical protein